MAEVAASAATKAAIAKVQAGITTLDDSLMELINHGSSLVSSGDWAGPLADQFEEAWTGRIKQNLNKSVETLQQISGEADKSATNIRAAGGAYQ